MPSFEEKIGGLKKPREMGSFGTEETRDLQQAMDILAELRQGVYGKNDVGWDKLRKARNYLNDILKKHLGDGENNQE